MRRLGLVVVTVGSLLGVTPGTTVTHAAVPPAGQRVFMVTDSVGLGAKAAMPKAFPADWQVTVAGEPALFVEQLVSKHVQYQPLSLFGDYAIVAGGYNYPYWDPARFDRSIDTMIAELLKKGTKHVFWVTLREVKQQYVTSSAWQQIQPYYWYFPTVNEHLRAALSRHPQLSLIDWASIADRTGLTYDAIHVNTTGAQVYSALAASTIRTAATRRPAGTVTEIAVAGTDGVPADALAVSLNVTAVNPRTAGFVTAYPCGEAQGTVSTVNHRPAQTVASAAIVPIGVDGKVCLFQSGDAHVVVDLNGAFGAGSGFVPFTPARAIDTRSGSPPAAGVPITVHLGDVAGAPDGSFTAVVNVTTVAAPTGNEVTLYTCGTPPPAIPSRSIEAKRTQNLLMVVTTDANGDVCAKVASSAHVVVDLFGAFTPTADIHPIGAQRLIDSGQVLPAGTAIGHAVAGVAGIPTTPAMPTGAVLTVTLVHPASSGFATVYPCADARPATSVVNVVPNHRQTNAGVVAIDSSGAVCVYVSVASHVLVDVSGWTGSAFEPMSPRRVFDSRWP